MNTHPRLRHVAFASFAALLASAGISQATIIDFSATATGTTGNWATNANWVGNTAPANNLTADIARFNQTSYTNQPNVGTSRSVAGLIIGDGTTATIALTIGGTALSLGGSGVTMNAAAGAAIISPTIALGANQVWSNNSANSLTVSAIVSGNFAIEQTGSGTIVLNGQNTFTGGYTLTSGTVRLNTTNSTGFGSGTVTLTGGAVGSTSSNRTLTNAVTLNGATQLGISATTGAIIFTGAVNVAADSQVDLVNGGGAFNGNTVTLNGNLTFNTAISGPVTGNTSTSAIADGATAHSITKSGTGIIVLSGANTYSGGTALNAGTLYAGSSTALGTGTVTFGGGTLDLRGFNLVTNTLAGSSGILTDTAGAGTRTLTIGQGDGSGAFGGVITQSTSAKIIAVTKSGTGTQKFSGANTYVGQTTISGGTLLINGTHVDASATTTAVNGYGSTTTGHYQVASGATLGGTGRIQGNASLANSNLILIQSGGYLAPGDGGIGALTIDGSSFSGTVSCVLNMSSGAVFDFQLSGTGGTPDQLIFWNYVSGDFLLNGNALNLSLSGTQAAGTYTIDLIKFYSNSGTTAVATALSSGFVLGTLGDGISSATINYNANTIGLTYTVAAIPEPATHVLLSGLVVLLVAARRRNTA